MGVGRWGMAGVVAVVLSGCFGDPPDAARRLLEVKEETAALDQQLSTMEERLLGNQANVKLWGELRERHGQITEVTCKSNLVHFDAMVKAMDKQEQKAREIKRRRSVASAGGLSSEGRPN